MLPIIKTTMSTVDVYLTFFPLRIKVSYGINTLPFSYIQSWHCVNKYSKKNTCICICILINIVNEIHTQRVQYILILSDWI